MLTGIDDLTAIRQYEVFNSTKRFEAKQNIYDQNGVFVENVTVNPWNGEVEIGGTDGLQFKSSLGKNDKLKYLVPELFRVASATYDGDDDEYGLDSLRYVVDFSMYQNQSVNKENSVYYACKYEGLSNLTSIYKAAAAASLGHFLSVKGLLTSEITRNGIKVTPSYSDDRSFFVVEQFSGTTLKAVNVQQVLFLS